MIANTIVIISAVTTMGRTVRMRMATSMSFIMSMKRPVVNMRIGMSMFTTMRICMGMV